MLVNETLEKLRSLRLSGMLKALEEQVQLPDVGQLSFEERLGLLVDREETVRNDRRFKSRMKSAKLKQQACIEDIDFKTPRKIPKSLILSLSSCDWIKNHQDLILTGPTGIGKSYIASALVHRACLQGFTALYIRISKLFRELAIAKVDGSYEKLMIKLGKTDLVVFDDWGLSALNSSQAQDFMEIIDDRHKSSSSIITSQVPIGKWFEIIGDPTIADAIMDRIANNAHKLELDGPSMRREKSKLTQNKEGTMSVK